MTRVDKEPMAVVSDVHGNVRALDAVLAEIARRGIRRVVNLGDCLYGPFDPRPSAERLMALAAPTVCGNEDRILVGTGSTLRTAGHPLSRTAATPLSRVARFTRARLEPRHLAWLGSLPLTATDGDALLCHGTPTADTVYLLSRVSAGALAIRSGGEIDALLGPVAQRLVLCGHDHTPRLVVCGERVIVNPGSVGCPAYADDVPEDHVVETASPHARFAVVHPGSGFHAVELIAVAYDAPAAAAEACANGFPDWAMWIATGRAQ
jgi:diadenosine tetraphosphatase ApaH/serine/threonine PP2A family protein phosphatase